jgi:hypothetical protein
MAIALCPLVLVFSTALKGNNVCDKDGARVVWFDVLRT